MELRRIWNGEGKIRDCHVTHFPITEVAGSAVDFRMVSEPEPGGHRIVLIFEREEFAEIVKQFNAHPPVEFANGVTIAGPSSLVRFLNFVRRTPTE